MHPFNDRLSLNILCLNLIHSSYSSIVFLEDCMHHSLLVIMNILFSCFAEEGYLIPFSLDMHLRMVSHSVTAARMAFGTEQKKKTMAIF